MDYDPSATMFLRMDQLVEFFRYLPQPMGFGMSMLATETELWAQIRTSRFECDFRAWSLTWWSPPTDELRIRTHIGGLVHFSDVALACARKVRLVVSRLLVLSPSLIHCVVAGHYPEQGVPRPENPRPAI